LVLGSNRVEGFELVIVLRNHTPILVVALLNDA